MDWYENYDLENIITPVKVDHLEGLLRKYGYDPVKREKLVKGFKTGFSLNYQGNKKNIQMNSPNLKLRVGSQTELWNKVMKEVKDKCFAGPFEKPPFESYIQSPIGLVPKDNGKKTRLIFHLSYPRNTGKSVNANIPVESCKVKYNDLDQAVRRCMEEGVNCLVAKSDMSMAFRNLPLNKSSWRWLIMKARHPITQKLFYFVDKCLPFGASISCKMFQDFSDAIAFIQKHQTKAETINYLDDFFFAAMLRIWCDYQVRNFLNLCSDINFPVSLEKTFWSSTVLIFLGLLLNTKTQTISIPKEKLDKAKTMIRRFIDPQKRKATVNDIQKLCGFLNFLCRAVVPGRAFTRRIYTLVSSNMKPHHHVKLPSEIKKDLQVWDEFLASPDAYARPFVDLTKFTAEDIGMFSDASKSLVSGGLGAICGDQWTYAPWNYEFLKQKDISIEYLELFAVVVAVKLWLHKFKNRRIYLHCDNMSVVHMINNSSSTCRNCMVLIRIITLTALQNNTRVFAQHIRTEKNKLADSLSRLKLKAFFELAPSTVDKAPLIIPDELWPIEKIWVD